LGARSSNQQRGRGVYASCLWPTMQYWGFLEGARDLKARNTEKEHTNEVQSGGRDPGVSRPGACVGQSPTLFLSLLSRPQYLCLSLLETLLTHKGKKKMSKKKRYESKENIQAHRASSKATRPFLT